MASMHGYFRWEGHATGAGALPAPYFDVFVGERLPDNQVAFLFDTGADYSTLNPKDAHRLFGDAYLGMDFSAHPSRIEMVGIGDAPAYGFRTHADLAFRTDDDGDVQLAIPIVIAQPTPREPGRRGNWLIPSLLGRDILQYFDLALPYNPPSVALTEAVSA